MEVLHGDIRITLSDQEAIRGMERIRASVKRQMKQIDREKAVIKIEGDMRELEKDLVLARRQLKKFEGYQAEVKLGIREGDFNAAIKRQQLKLKAMEGQRVDLQVELKGQREALGELKALEQQLHKTEIAQERYEDGVRKAVRTQEKAAVAAQREGLEIAKLRSEYDKANQALQRLEQTGRLRRRTSPEAQMQFDIKTGQLIEQMAVTRAKLKAMNADPIDIPVDVKQSRALHTILGLGDIGMRLGPFTGTLKQFATAALVLGPIITGLVGAITALAGAVGVGLTGAIGIGATGLAAFGLTLGGVGALIASLMRDFKNLNTLQDAYHKQVLKTGAESDKAKVKLKEFNHALGAVVPTTREAFLALDELTGRWRDLRKEAKPQFFDALGQAILTVNTNFGIFSRETLNAFGVVTDGFQRWMRGLRGAEAQNILFVTMRNTTEAVEELMPALGHLGSAFGRTMASFSRHFGPILGGFNAWAAGLDAASRNTRNLNMGVDHLVDSFNDTLGVLTAFSRVVIELSRAAMGPGGDLMDDMANGLNEIASTIRDNPRPIRDFFADSIGTVRALYGVLQPLMQLFMEFSTILRPATTAVLSILGPLVDLTAALAGFGPIRAALQAWATIWLFKRGAAMAVGVMAGAVHGLAAAMERLGRAQAAQKLTGVAGGMRGVPVGGVGGAVRPIPAGGFATAPRAAPVAQTGFARGIGGVTRGLGALTTGLLGVSAPVAAVGAAAIGAAIGIKKMSDAAEDRREVERRTRAALGDAGDRKVTIRQPPGPQSVRGGINVDARTYTTVTNEAIKAAEAIEDVNNAVRESGRIQREMVSLGSQLQNSRLMVEQAEKAYGDAVKTSGKNSLEARMALQQLRDARTAEVQSTKAWGEAQEQAGRWVQRAVERAQAAANIARGTGLEDVMSKRLEDAKNSAAAFEVNMRRAKKGIDIFTGEGSEKIGAFVREFGKIPGVKRTLVRVETQEAALKIAGVIKSLSDLGLKKTVTRILANADNPREALRDLNAALDRWEARHPVAELRADKRQAETSLNNANKQLSLYGARKPEALLKARDDAQAKLDRLNKQLDHLNGKQATVTANVKFVLPSDFRTDAGSGGYGGGGDGWGVPNIGSAVKSFAMRNGGRLSKMWMESGGLGGASATGSGLNAFNSIATRFGLTIGSGLRPGSITSSGNLSYHAMGRARDFPGPAPAMMAFARFMASAFGTRLKELIYTPLGFSIKNGQRTAPYAQADHYDHVHVAMARGGKEGPKPGRYTKPTTIVYAEEPGHPEYFISTNPRDRKRSQRLLIEAANEIGGIREHTPQFHKMARGGKFDKNGVSAYKRRLIERAAEQYGIPPYVLYGVYGAESGFGRNLGPSSAGARGPFQFMPATARGMGVNPMNFKSAVFGAAKYLGQYKGRGIRGMLGAYNAGPAGNINNPETMAYIPKVLKLGGGFKSAGGGGGGGGGGRASTPVEKAVLGARTNFANMLASAEARLGWAEGTSRFSDDIRAIFGYKRPGARPKWAGSGSSFAQRGRMGGKPTRVPGMIDLLQQQNREARERDKEIRKSLKGRLTPTRRRELLEERATLTQNRATNRTRIRDLRNQGEEARFERGMATKGPGSRAMLDTQKALAGRTESLDDDLAAARAEQKYYQARVVWAKGRGDVAGANEARNAYNTATNEIKSITNDIRNNRFQVQEAWQTFAEGQAQLTGTLNDDFAAATRGLAYWNARVREAWGRNDPLAALAAAGNVQQYTERVVGLREDMRRLPLERDRALAALTDDLGDDKAATIALRDYWQTRLDAAKKGGDLAGQIEAAGNLKSLNDEIKQAEQTIATQMVLLSDARRNLYKEFGSNFIPVGPAIGSPHPVDSGTTVNLTVNGAELGPDPHTWSQNVAWELQAAV